MKPSTATIVLSLVINAVLGGLLWRSPSVALPKKVTSEPASHTTENVAAVAIARGDFGAMRAAGVPETMAKEIALGAAFARRQAQIRAVKPALNPDPRYWRNSSGTRVLMTPEQSDALTKAEREFADFVTGMFGSSVSLKSLPEGRLSFLAPWKAEQVLRLEQDFQDMTNEASRPASGRPLLDSDRKKIAMLGELREQELSRLLSTEERQRYDLAGSPNGMNRVTAIGPGLETEEDLKTVAAILQTPRTSTAEIRQSYDQVREALGDERFATLQKAVDLDRRQLNALTQRLGLPPENIEKVLALRESYAGESQKIVLALGGANSPEKTAQFAAMNARVRADLLPLLGPDATQAYMMRQQNWPELLSRNVAFTTNRNEMLSGPNSFSATYPWSGPPRPPPPISGGQTR